MIRYPRLVVAAAITLTTGAAAYAQGCQPQSSMNAMAGGTWNQVLGDNVAECGLNGSGPQQKGLTTGVNCVPVTLAPGDITPTSGGSVNGWSLYVPPGEDGNGQWYGGLMYNGQQVSDGYFIALREVNGTVYAEEAKGSGWQIADPNNPGDAGNTWQYVSAPPPSGCGSNNSASFTPPPAAGLAADGFAADGSPAASIASIPSSDSSSGQSCPGMTLPGAVTPNNGSFTVGTNTYAVSSTDNDAATINGQAINDGAYQTAQLVQGSDGNIYGQSNAPDNNGQWEQLSSDGTYWIPLNGTPAAIAPASGSPASAVSTGTDTTAQNMVAAVVCPQLAPLENQIAGVNAQEAALQAQIQAQTAAATQATQAAAAAKATLAALTGSSTSPSTTAVTTATSPTGNTQTGESGGNSGGDGGDAGAAGGGGPGP